MQCNVYFAESELITKLHPHFTIVKIASIQRDNNLQTYTAAMELLKIDKEGRMNLNILKNLFLYIFTLSVCKICTLQSKKKKKNRGKIVKLRTYSRSITPSLYAPVRFWTDPFLSPPYLRTYFMDGPIGAVLVSLLLTLNIFHILL